MKILISNKLKTKILKNQIFLIRIFLNFQIKKSIIYKSKMKIKNFRKILNQIKMIKQIRKLFYNKIRKFKTKLSKN